MLQNDLLLRALRREPVPHAPVWLMRQAGRYLPEYNALRGRAGSFMGLATQPELATAVTLQPLERFALDAAILFSDILTIPDAMGLGLSFAEGEGPRFARRVADEAAVRALAVPDMEALRYVFDAVAMIKRALAGRVPLIGFAGSPFTLACYMIEGRGSSDGFAAVRRMAAQRADLLERIVSINAEAVRRYLAEQVAAGADVLMLFDTWGGLLPVEAYRRFSLGPMRRIVAGLREHGIGVPCIVFTKQGGAWLEDLAGSGADAVGLDWTVDLATARRTVGRRVALQGNLDPVVLTTDPRTVAREAERVVRAAGAGPGYVFNLGHGILPATPPEHVGVLVDTVHRVSAELESAAGGSAARKNAGTNP